MPHDGHDRPTFRARSVVEAERIPSNDVGVFDGAIRLGPNGQSVVGSVAVCWVYASPVPDEECEIYGESEAAVWSGGSQPFQPQELCVTEHAARLGWVPERGPAPAAVCKEEIAPCSSLQE